VADPEPGGGGAWLPWLARPERPWLYIGPWGGIAGLPLSFAYLLSLEPVHS